MLFVEKSLSRAPYRVLWESKALAPLQRASASKNPLYRVWQAAVWRQFVLALAPGASNLCPRTQGKKVMATGADLCEEEEWRGWQARQGRQRAAACLQISRPRQFVLHFLSYKFTWTHVLNLETSTFSGIHIL